MPLDRKDSGSTWQAPPIYKAIQPDAPWEPDDDEMDIPPVQQEQEQEIPTVPTSINTIHIGANEQVENESEGVVPSGRTALMSQIGRYSSFILAPLLFAGLTSLIVLPTVAIGRANLPPQTLFPLAIIILAIALAQGVATYYTDTTNGLWAIYTVAGFFLFMLVGCFALFGPIPGIIMLLVFAGLSIFLIQRYSRSVSEEEVYIVRSFGKYKRTLLPGFNILLPWEQTSRPLSTAETTWKTPVQRIQMTRDEDVVLRGSMSYQLLPEDAYLVTSVKNWEESLQDIFVASLQTVAKTFTPEDFIAWPQGMHMRPTHGSAIPLSEGEARWEQVNGQVLQRVRDRAALWGVLINEVRLYDIALAPHGRSLQDETTEPIVQRNVEPVVPQRAAPQVQPVAQPIVAPPQQLKRSTPPQSAVANAQVPKGLKEETLRKAYTEVKNGNIKEAETIRNLAAQFEAVANNPELNNAFTFDAGRAAANLYAEADRRQEEEEANAGTLFTDETKVDWPRRRATDENIMSGG